MCVGGGVGKARAPISTVDNFFFIYIRDLRGKRYLKNFQKRVKMVILEKGVGSL